MKPSLLLWSAAAAAALVTAQAQPTGTPPPTATPAQGQAAATPASKELGARLASQGVPNVAPCASCHGANGEGNAAGGFPRIAGQSSSYLARQLRSYANGERKNPVMEPIAKALNDEQRAAAAGYYATLVAPTAPASSAAASAGSAASAPSRALQQRGAQLAGVGDNAIRVQACVNCHGPGGIGEAFAYPYLAGQHASYLQAVLGEWKSGARKTDPSGQMVLIAKALSDADVRAVAAYYSGLPAPGPRDADLATPWRAAGRTAVVSGPRPGTGERQQTQGVGTEQGAPLSGAQGQGPGGTSGGGSQRSPTGESKTGTAVQPDTGASAPR